MAADNVVGSVPHSSVSPDQGSVALAQQIRRLVIEQSRRANVGHIGSSLSIADLLAVLFGDILRGEPFDPDRDRFILSKGHAALALYAALHCRGTLTRDHLLQFCSDGTALGAHPEHLVDGIDFSTGSLGQGPSLGAGCALAARLQGSDRHVYTLISDAELNEGSLWEAVMFAAHHRLGHLTFLLDANGQQAFGYTRDVLGMADIGRRFSDFGWRVTDVDGHDHAGIRHALSATDAPDAPPHLVLARTTFGKGVSFMESRIEWHYLPLSDEQFDRAMAELDGAGSI